MKYRKGFVSNSSSSSFIIGLDKKPDSIEEIKKILFGDKEIYSDPYNDSYYKTIEVAKTVYTDLRDQVPLTKEKILEELSSGWVKGAPQFDYTKENDIGYSEEHQKKSEEFLDNLADKLISDFKGNQIFVLEYSDDTMYGCALEHGTLFDNLEHVFRISKH